MNCAVQWIVQSGPGVAGAGPLCAVVLWHHHVQSTMLYDHGRAHI